MDQVGKDHPFEDLGHERRRTGVEFRGKCQLNVQFSS